jgi:Tat protein translocase TatC
MATEPEEEYPRDTDAEEGGPVKSFLEHLEDLRWVLIKSVVSIGVCMLLCLIAGNHVVGILKYPLEKAQARYAGDEPLAIVMFGTNRLGNFGLDLDQWDTLTGATNGKPFLFTQESIVNFKSLAGRLKEPGKDDLVSQYLTNVLSEESRRLVANYPTGFKAFWRGATMYFRKDSSNDAAVIEREVRPWLVADLNRILQTNHLYDESRFESTALSPETTNLIAMNPQSGPDLARLNRKLLLQAYPELRKRFIAVDLVPKNDGTGLSLGLRVDTSERADRLAKQMHVDLNTLSPAGGFFVAFQVAIYGGIALSSPLLFYFIAQFVFPALKWNERKYIYRGMAFALPLFFCGAAFCYFVLMPVALAASQIYSNWLGFSANIWQAEEYISFVSKFILGMGLGFEMPVVILVLVKIGIVDYRMLAKGRRYMIIINLVLGALLTTPEVLTQILMALPLQVLYEISIWIAWYWERKERKLREKEEREERGIRGND